MEDHWQKMREAGRASLQKEAERRYPNPDDYELRGRIAPDVGAVRDAFEDGGEYALDAFVQAMEIREGRPLASD
jgi:hypothetical protein